MGMSCQEERAGSRRRARGCIRAAGPDAFSSSEKERLKKAVLYCMNQNKGKYLLYLTVLSIFTPLNYTYGMEDQSILSEQERMILSNEWKQMLMNRDGIIKRLNEILDQQSKLRTVPVNSSEKIVNQWQIQLKKLNKLLSDQDLKKCTNPN